MGRRALDQESSRCLCVAELPSLSLLGSPPKQSSKASNHEVKTPILLIRMAWVWLMESAAWSSSQTLQSKVLPLKILINPRARVMVTPSLVFEGLSGSVAGE